MEAAIIGLLGALLGAILTYAFNRKNAFETRIHQTRIDAYKTFAEAAMEYCRAEVEVFVEAARDDVQSRNGWRQFI